MRSRFPIMMTAAVTAMVLRAASVGAVDDPIPVCGDVNHSGAVSSSDAQLVLKVAVGQPTSLACKACPTPTFFGNLKEFAESSTHAPNYLLGSLLEIPESIVLTHLGVVGRPGGAQVQLGLYTDNGGEPDQLVASTAVHVLGVGENWFPVAATSVPAGDYWIMGVYDSNASIAFSTFDDSAVVKYRDLVFSGTLPTTFGPADSYPGQTFNYYVHGIR